jgi:SAM-dependent methyltransferase
MTAADRPAPTFRLGGREVPEDWPVMGEASRTFREKLQNGFFAAYMDGDVIIDLGYRGYTEGAVPIFPHATGVDLDYPGYDGIVLPFADHSVDTLYSSHVLEHISDYRGAIRDWYRVIKTGGFIVCIVPHQFLYEKNTAPPSLWNGDHKRFYTPASLVSEFEEALPANSYRVRHLRDEDSQYTYDVGPQLHAGGGYEIELVVQKIERPQWRLIGEVEDRGFGLAAGRAELAAERDRLAAECARWFDAAIPASAERIFERRPRRRRRLSRVREWFAGTAPAPSSRSPAVDLARSAADAQRWERAARFYLDALQQDPGNRELWHELGRALERAGKAAEAEFAHRQAARPDAAD